MSTGNPSMGRQPPEWEKHENEITELLVHQQKTLREVMELMSSKHGFHATERQYKYRFGCLKNIDSGEWAWIADEVRRRAALGKKTAVYLRGQPLPQERVSRGITRIQRKGVRSRAKERTSRGRRKIKDANRITFRTPSPSPPPPNPAASPPHEDAEATPPARVSQGRTLVARRQEPSVDDSGIITGTDIDANGLLAAQPNLAYQLESPRVPELPPASRPHAQVNAIRPSRVYGLKRNLPFFELLSAIHWPASPMPNLSNTWSAVLGSAPTLAHSGLFMATRDLFTGSFGLASSEPSSSDSLAEFIENLQRVIPERFTGDLLQTFQLMLDPALPVPSVVLLPFAVAAFLASNDFIMNDAMDEFLRFIVMEEYTGHLLHFMSIQLPTVYTFFKVVFASAIRTTSVELLNAMLDTGIDPGPYPLYTFVRVGNAVLSRRILSSTSTADLMHMFLGDMEEVLQLLVRQEQFGLAELFLKKVDIHIARSWWLAALYQAVRSKDVQEASSLLKTGANAGLELSRDESHESLLELAIGQKNVEMIELLWDHGARMPSKIEAMPTIDWLRLHDRGIFDLVMRLFALDPTGFLLDDALDAANLGRPALETYISSQAHGVTALQLEKTLEESIHGNRVIAAMSLLQYGVDPNGLTLARRPLATALSVGEKKAVFVQLLLQYQADVGQLTVREITNSSELLGAFLRFGPDYARKMEALMVAAETGNIVSASMLLPSLPANDIDKPWPTWNALQLAARGGRAEMIHFLINGGANVNAPTSPHEGCTALQAALSGREGSLELAEILLRYGADASAPSALNHGTVLEAVSKNYEEQLFHRLLDAGATVNRPSGKPSSVLHGVIKRGWHKALRRCLEPQHKTIANHMCWSRIVETRYHSELTPTQLAAFLIDLEAVEMLVAYGADVNEAPGEYYGRTALQAAALRKPGARKMRLVHFLLNNGANINADPAKEGGVTALQAAAIAGDLFLAELLILRGAEAKAAPTSMHGMTAMECALKYKRQDMVQLLRNAGAEGT